jgi:hypothetical protein
MAPWLRYVCLDLRGPGQGHAGTRLPEYASHGHHLLAAPHWLTPAILLGQVAYPRLYRIFLHRFVTWYAT